MSNFKSPNPNIAPLSEKEAAMIDQMSDAISTMPREHMSELQKWFLRLTEHTYRLQIKFQNLAIHASNQEKKADDLIGLVGKIKDVLDTEQHGLVNGLGDQVHQDPTDRHLLDMIEMHINEMITDDRKKK
ncbi:hypothetical protein SEA_CHEWYVIII_30 [Rhodococcus phage ChewyVIII]|uniref:Uncharacterized protein n=1 Tax=Rhodococcus phage ChewyVIII TaxID=1887657 RepID=A0A1C9EI56_9CAUD|nr:hypothetical protein QEH30_gp30 [Rhodococcus phage ChewyVIII]AON97452.1 hypothetical protein SEA_CHEWYVIII_30 [Rhodococcus phage ChewyVIII]